MAITDPVLLLPTSLQTASCACCAFPVPSVLHEIGAPRKSISCPARRLERTPWSQVPSAELESHQRHGVVASNSELTFGVTSRSQSTSSPKEKMPWRGSPRIRHGMIDRKSTRLNSSHLGI